MQEIKNKYGLRQKSTGQLVGFEISSNSGGDFCVEDQYILEVGGEKLWLVDDPQQAEFVRLNPTEWYNAGYDTPSHDFDANDFEVVVINVAVVAKPVNVRVPTPYEFFEAKYSKKEPRHWEYLKKEIEENADTRHEVRYSWYELVMLKEEMAKRNKKK